jgi:hypothetical protein
MIINEIEIYKLNTYVESKYRNNAIHGADINIEVLERKFTALILNAKQ